MAVRLTLVGSELRASSELTPGSITLVNETGAMISLTSSVVQFRASLPLGPSQVELPEAPSLEYEINGIRGILIVRMRGMRMELIKLEDAVHGVVNIVGLTNDQVAHLVCQSGRVYMWKVGEKKLQDGCYDVSKAITPLEANYDERGLLDLALAPDGRWFIFMTVPPPANSHGIDHRNCIYEIHRDGALTMVLSYDCKEKQHNGGKLLVANPYLYVGTGDNSAENDPARQAQDLQVLHGKVLRFNIKDPAAPKPQETNPVGTADSVQQGIATMLGRPEIYASGLRNCSGLSMNDAGMLIATDQGQRLAERVNVILKGGNFGWSDWEGSAPTPWGGQPPGSTNRVAQFPPVFEYAHRQAIDPTRVGIVGGFPLLDFAKRPIYLFGDVSGRIYAALMREDQPWTLLWNVDVRQQMNGFLRAFGRDGLGNIYVVFSETLSPMAKSYIYALYDI